MKTFSKALTITLAIMSAQAHAFVTVIDATNYRGEVLTLNPSSGQGINDLTGQKLEYRGLPQEAVSLMKKLVKQEYPAELSEVSYEINQQTKTLAVTVVVNGYIQEYSYWILPKKSN